MEKFNTRSSRLFSGDPSALFAADAKRYTVGTTIQNALSTPFNFQLDTDQCPQTVFWLMQNWVLQLFNGAANLTTGLPQDSAVRILLMSNEMVGSTTQQTPGTLAGINPQNYGIDFPIDYYDTFNQSGGGAGVVRITSTAFKYFIVPPGFFVRTLILDNGFGPNQVPAGTTIQMQFLRTIVNIQEALCNAGS
jgi:hypothetical protein